GVGHLRGVLAGGGDGDQTAPLLGDGHVTRGPGDHAVYADALGIPRAAAVLDHRPLLAVVRDVLLGGVDVVGGRDPVEAVGVPGPLVRVVAQAVVAQPLLGDVPV